MVATHRSIGWRVNRGLSQSAPPAVQGVAFQFDGEASLAAGTLSERSETIAVDNTGTSVSLNTGASTLEFPLNATPAHGDHGLRDAAVSRAAGVALVVEIASITTSAEWAAGFNAADTVDFGGTAAGAWIAADGANDEWDLAVDGDVVTVDGDPDNAQTLVVVLRSAGAFYIVDDTLLWVDGSYSTASLYPFFGNYDSVIDVDAFVETTLTGVESALKTDELTGSISSSTAFTHEADFVMRFTATASSGFDILDFRRQDASNQWEIRVQPDRVKLNETVGGSSAQRAVNMSVANNSDMAVIGEGTTISVYLDNARIINYGSATNFSTETDGLVVDGGVYEDLTTWARDVPASVVSQYDGVIE